VDYTSNEIAHSFLGINRLNIERKKRGGGAPCWGALGVAAGSSIAPSVPSSEQDMIDKQKKKKKNKK
jgi:hypothetical protein